MRKLTMQLESTDLLDIEGPSEVVTLTINGEDRYFSLFCLGSKLDNTKDHRLLYTLNEVESKSIEEVAAEESVAKAKEALKAAENALKVVKGSK